MFLLYINGKDFSQKVNYKSYNVTSTDVCNEWIDGFGTIHKDKYRERISGSFDMAFLTSEEYQEFISAVQASKTEKGSVKAELYVSGLVNDMVESNFFMDITLKKHQEANVEHVVTIISVGVEEE